MKENQPSAANLRTEKKSSLVAVVMGACTLALLVPALWTVGRLGPLVLVVFGLMFFSCGFSAVIHLLRCRHAHLALKRLEVERAGTTSSGCDPAGLDVDSGPPAEQRLSYVKYRSRCANLRVDRNRTLFGSCLALGGLTCAVAFVFWDVLSWTEVSSICVVALCFTSFCALVALSFISVWRQHRALRELEYGHESRVADVDRGRTNP